MQLPRHCAFDATRAAAPVRGAVLLCVHHAQLLTDLLPTIKFWSLAHELLLASALRGCSTAAWTQNSLHSHLVLLDPPQLAFRRLPWRTATCCLPSRPGLSLSAGKRYSRPPTLSSSPSELSMHEWSSSKNSLVASYRQPSDRHDQELDHHVVPHGHRGRVVF